MVRKGLECIFVLLMSSLANAAPVSVEKVTHDLTRIIDRLKWSQKCESFVNDGSLGPWGKFLIKQLNRSSYPEMYRSTPDLQLVCPRFNQMSDEEIEYVWFVALTAMSFHESSCNARARARGPNGTAFGLLQLHLNRESRYSDRCRRGDAQSAEGSIRCTLAMIDDQLRREQRFFADDSYWDVLRPKARSQKAKQVAWAMMLLPLCRTPEAQARSR